MENYDFRLTNTLGFPVVLNKTTVNTWKKKTHKINTNEAYAFILFPWGLFCVLTMLSSWTLRALFRSVKFQIYFFHQSKGYEALCNRSENFSPRHKQSLNVTDQVGIILSDICNTANNFFQNHWLVEGSKCSLPDGEAKVDLSLWNKKLFYLWEHAKKGGF